MFLVCRLILLLSGILYSSDMAFIESKPQGVVRDFYIYEYLQGDVSYSDAIKLYPLIDNKNPKIINALIEKIPQDKLPKELYCKNASERTEPGSSRSARSPLLGFFLPSLCGIQGDQEQDQCRAVHERKARHSGSGEPGFRRFHS